MKAILDEIFRGNITPHEKGFGKDSEYGKALREFNAYEEAITAKLSEEEQEQLQAFSDAQAELSNIECRKLWKQGFCLGIRIGMEIADELSEE